jgi:hypothetical protein
MATSRIPESGHYSTGVRSIRHRNAITDVLQLASELSSRLSMPIEGEQSHGVRLRLARAQALSIVDLLTDIAADSIRLG